MFRVPELIQGAGWRPEMAHTDMVDINLAS